MIAQLHDPMGKVVMTVLINSGRIDRLMSGSRRPETGD